MNRIRLQLLVRLAWTYAVRSLERPVHIPLILRNVFGRRAHLGETLNATRFRDWLRHSGIDTIIDVGAHEGEFASGVKGVLPDCTLYAFEPQPAAFAKLQRRLAAYANARAFNVALGSTCGVATFHQSSFTKGSSLLPMTELQRTLAGDAVNADIAVRVETLDHALPLAGAGTVLLKLDVQGYELEVLKGGAATLACVDYVLVETSVGGPLYHGEARFGDVYAVLTRAGFEFAGTWDQLRHPRTGVPLQIDAIFRRSPPRHSDSRSTDLAASAQPGPA